MKGFIRCSKVIHRLLRVKYRVLWNWNFDSRSAVTVQFRNDVPRGGSWFSGGGKSRGFDRSARYGTAQEYLVFDRKFIESRNVARCVAVPFSVTRVIKTDFNKTRLWNRPCWLNPVEINIESRVETQRLKHRSYCWHNIADIRVTKSWRLQTIIDH